MILLWNQVVVCSKFLFVYMLFENIGFLDITCHLDVVSVPRGCWTGRNSQQILLWTQVSFKCEVMFVYLSCASKGFG